MQGEKEVFKLGAWLGPEGLELHFCVLVSLFFHGMHALVRGWVRVRGHTDQRPYRGSLVPYY